MFPNRKASLILIGCLSLCGLLWPQRVCASLDFVYPQFANISIWNSVIEATFPGAKVIWSNETADMFINAVIRNEAFYVCFYPKDPADFERLWREGRNWRLTTPDGIDVTPDTVSSDSESELRVYYFVGNREDWVKKVYYFGNRILLPRMTYKKIVIVFERLGIKLEVALDGGTVKATGSRLDK